MTATPGINNLVSETLGITVELQITSLVTTSLNRTCSWHLVEALLWRAWIKPLLTCVGWLDLKMRYQPVWVGFLSTFAARTSRKGLALSDSFSTVNVMESPKLLKWLRKFCNCFGPWGQTLKCVINILEPQCWFMLCQFTVVHVRIRAHPTTHTYAHECTIAFKVFYTCLSFITMNTGNFGRKDHCSLVPTKINDLLFCITRLSRATCGEMSLSNMSIT
jgi:hypothetical protein